jgi:hypothetical protein
MERLYMFFEISLLYFARKRKVLTGVCVCVCVCVCVYKNRAKAVNFLVNNRFNRR